MSDTERGITERGKQAICSECGEPMTGWEVREPQSRVVAERVEYTCDNGHLGYENYDNRGLLSQRARIKWRPLDTESDPDGGAG